jgi:hypothetical protein
VFQHEFGFDEVISATDVRAVQSFFETGDVTWAAQGPMGDSWMGIDRWTRVSRVEPDFIQSGDMTMIIRGRAYARSPTIDSPPYIFGPDTEKIDLREQRRQLRFRFESNTLGGYYEGGQTMAHLDLGDGRQ